MNVEEFGIYLNYVRKLGFEETPDYDFLRELFVKVMKGNGDVDDGSFDWNLLNGEPQAYLFSLFFATAH
jgi:casein kinase 1